jgi:hypothetical protein
MEKFSTTQVSNFVSLLVVVFGLLKINIAPEEVQSGISALVLIISLSVNIYNRAKKGDLRLGVIKKV